MPVGRQTAVYLAQAVSAQFNEAQRLMMARIARNLKAGIDGPNWAVEKAAQMAAYQVQMRDLVAQLQQTAQSGVRTAMEQAYEKGGLAAVTDLSRLGIEATAPQVARVGGLAAVEKVVAATMGKLNATGPRILRSTMGVYQSTVAAGVNQVLLGTQTRIQAAQGVLDDFAQSGVTGFVDSAGRGWNLASYAEMAVRTGTMNAAVAGHVDTLVANDVTLGIISADGSPCEICVDWEGEIVSLDGSDDNYPSLDDAIADGLFHPNCEHTCDAYQEGVTQAPPAKSDAVVADQAQTYQASQQQRYLERQVRASKNMLAVALDDDAASTAAARIATYQGKLRDLVSSNDDLTRQYAREQIGKAH